MFRTSIKQSGPLIFLLTLLNSLLLLASSQKISVLVIFFLCLFSLNIVVLSKDRKRIMVFFLIGSLVALGFYHYWIAFYENSYFLGKKSDDWQYDIYWTENFIERYGLNLTKLPNHLNSIESGLGILHNSKGYVGLVIIFRWIGSFLDGYHTLMPRIFNIYILALTAYYSSRIAFSYSKDEKIKRMTLAIVFFFPVMLYNSVHVFRDTLISFLIVIIYYRVIYKRYSFVTFLVVTFSMYYMYYLRTSTLFLLILMICLLYLNPKRINLRLAIPFFVFGLLTIYLLKDFVDLLDRQLETYKTLNVERFGTIGSKIFSLPIYLGAIPRVIYLIFTPVPNFSGFHQFYTSISAFAQVLTFPYLYLGLKSNKIDIKLTLTFLMFFLGVAFSTATFRHVMMYLPFGIIITVMSIKYYSDQIHLSKQYFNLLILLFSLFVVSIAVAFTF